MRLDFGAPLTHLLVDLDGTILGNRSIPLSIDFTKQALTQLRRYTGWRKAAKILLEIQDELKHSSTSVTNDVRVVELFSQRLKIAPEEGRAILRESLSLIFPGLEKHFYPMTGAKEFLAWAKERYTLILATNPVWPPEIIELRVRWAGIDPAIFTEITHVRTMRACKPSPEYYQQILEHRKLSAADCLLIGNDVKMDLPATRIGIRVFIIGKFKSISAVKLAGAKADAWKGSYDGLRAALEKHFGLEKTRPLS